VYDKTVRRRRAALLIFVALSIGLLTVYFGEPASGGLHAIQRGAQEVLAPIEEGASRAFKPFRDLVNWTGDVFDAKSENKKLKDEVADLREGLAEAQTAQREAEQLRDLVGLPKDDLFPQNTEPVTARVIARSPTSWQSSVQIDKGSSEGIDEDMPVIAAGRDGDVVDGGLAGKVTAVSGGTATVTLITDESSAVSAQVMPDGAAGIVKPTVGDPSDMLLDFIERGLPVSRDTTVITSGSRSDRFESLFPRGIPIGRVTKVDAEERELYQRVHLEPFADLKRMDFVQVLTRRGEEQARAALP
jgi:rod shape-determining protein MreC